MSTSRNRAVRRWDLVRCTFFTNQEKRPMQRLIAGSLLLLLSSVVPLPARAAEITSIPLGECVCRVRAFHSPQHSYAGYADASCQEPLHVKFHAAIPTDAGCALSNNLT